MELLSKKALRDLFGNRSRILMTFIAMILGTVAFGTFTFTREMINREIDAEYGATNPASATIQVSEVSDDLLSLIDGFEDIDSYEIGAAHELTMIRHDGKLKRAWMFASPSFEQRKINIVTTLAGGFNPGIGEILVDSGAMSVAAAQLGDNISLRGSDGEVWTFAIGGLVNDLSQHPPSIHDHIYVYVSSQTLAEMGLSMNRIDYLITGDAYDRARIMAVSQSFIRMLEENGYRVGMLQVSNTPGVSMHREEYRSVLLIMHLLAVAAFLFSCITMSSLFSTLLVGQIKQIGILKSLGVKTPHIARAYMGAALLFILSNLAVSLPLSCLAARSLSVFFMSIGNMKIHNFTIPSHLYMAFCAAGSAVPLMLAWVPINKGLKSTIKEALTDPGADGHRGKRSETVKKASRDRIIGLLPGNMPRPVLLSIRSAIENRRRFTMNVALLTLGGLMFVGSVGAVIAMNMAVSQSVNAWQFDYQIATSAYTVDEKLLQAIEGQANVVACEIWGATSGQIIHGDGTIGHGFGFTAIPPDSTLYLPNLMEGRWLENGDINAAIVSCNFAKQEPGYVLGDSLRFKFGDMVQEFKIVGMINEIGDSSIYISMDGYDRIVARNTQSGSSTINLVIHKARFAGRDAHEKIYNSILSSISESGVSILQTVTKAEYRKIVSSHYDTTLISFVVAAISTVVVAGIGLATTMSLQVNARVREIGILKAIGEIPLSFSPFAALSALGIWFLGILIIGRTASRKAARSAAAMRIIDALAG